MTKETGLGDRLFVNGFDLSGDIGSIQTIKRTVGEFNATGINKEAIERLQLLADGEINFNNYFTGTGASGAHERLRNLATTAVVTYFRGTTNGGTGAGLVAKQFDYTLNRAANGGLMGAVQCKTSGGVATEWGYILDVDATSTTGAGEAQSDEVDLGASHGIDDMAFYIHCTAFSGTDATVIIQTDDNDSFSSPTTYKTLTQITAARAYERIEAGWAPERYIRWRVSGTFTTITFSILAAPIYD